MMRTLTALLLTLVLLTPAYGQTRPNGIADLTLEELGGPRISKDFRTGVLTGVFLALSGSKAMLCPLASAKMMIAAIDAAVQAKEISEIWTVYHASLYVLVRMGCRATEEVKPDA